MDHNEYFNKAANEALKAQCLRAKCGSVIVSSDGTVIGRGYNAPPLEDESQRMCDKEWDLANKPKYDKTCCVHAEWNAILDACRTDPVGIDGSTLYFMRIDEEGSFTDAGEPFCTVCSRLALQSGVKYFSLWVDGAEKRYETTEYNKASYDFHNFKGTN